MIALEIAANIAELFAGLAIVGAAIKAWPVFSGMESRLKEQRVDREILTRDMVHFRGALKEQFGVETDKKDARELIRLLLERLPSRSGSDLHFEYFPSAKETPGRLSYTRYLGAEGERRPEFVLLSAEGYRHFIDAVKSLSRASAHSSDRHGYIELATHRYLAYFADSISAPIATLRVIPDNVLEVEELGINSEAWWPRVEPLLSRSQPCAVMTAGPLGSGKSTTAAALVSYTKRHEDRKIVTVELPVEFVHERVTQMTCSDPDGLEAIYRSACAMYPDVLFVGCENAGYFIWDAYGGESNRCVMGSLTARDAASALTLINREGRAVMKSIEAPFIIIGQALVRKLCRDCRRPVELQSAEREVISQIVESYRHCRHVPEIADKFSEPGGCDKCSGGYLGRLALTEMLDVTQEMLDMGEQSSRETRRNAIAAGMVSIQLRALEMASHGQIAFSMVKKLSRDYEYDITW